MAVDPADRINTYYLSLPAADAAFIGSLRDQPQLGVAQEGGLLWVKGLLPQQLEWPAVRSLPRKQLYEARGGQLFPLGSLLPAGREPALLWTPIARALPLQQPKENFNYFGNEAPVAVTLVASGKEQVPGALLVPLGLLADYCATAPAVRLAPLRWTVAGDYALVLGQPLLPLPGQALWQRGRHWLPAGLDFEFPVLAPMLEQRLMPHAGGWLVWDADHHWWGVRQSQLRPLTRASVRRTLNRSHAST